MQLRFPVVEETFSTNVSSTQCALFVLLNDNKVIYLSKASKSFCVNCKAIWLWKSCSLNFRRKSCTLKEHGALHAVIHGGHAALWSLFSGAHRQKHVDSGGLKQPKTAGDCFKFCNLSKWQTALKPPHPGQLTICTFSWPRFSLVDLSPRTSYIYIFFTCWWICNNETY